MKALAILLACLAWGCHRPVHRGTFLFQLGHGGYAHPARVPVPVVKLALTGRVPDGEAAGLAVAIAGALGRAAPDQVVYYRHPDGGAYLFAVEGDKLVVSARGLRAGGQPEGRYPLSELAQATEHTGWGKHAEPGPVLGISGGGAELAVQSAYAVQQFIFVAGTFAGTVPPGQTRIFRVPLGHQTVTASDTGDGSGDPIQADFDFTAGQRSGWSILPKI